MTADFNLTDEQLDKLESMQVQCDLEKIGLLDAVMGLSRSVPGGRLSLRVMM